ncbi:MAG: ArnT family glycosyltransferase, partial [Anaerolineae bacterium]
SHLHPDERYLTMVVSAIRFPSERLGPGIGEDEMGVPACRGLRPCLASYWNTDESPLNPANYDAYASYVYGTFPLFITRAAARWLDAACALIGTGGDGQLSGVVRACASHQFVGYDGIHLVGRALSGAMDIATLIALMWLGRLLYGRLTGLLAGALYAFAVLPVQHAHFFVVDSFATVFVVWSLLFCALAVRNANHWLLLPAGAVTGMAVACKISVWPLAGIVALAALLLARRKPTGDVSEPPQTSGPGLIASLAALALAGVAAALAFRSLQPYAFSGPGFFDIGLNPKWLSAMREVRELMGGLRDVPFGHQWTARLPVVFPWRNMVIWGLGLPLGIAATVGWGWMGWDLAVGAVVGTAVRTGARTATTSSVMRHTAHLLPWVWSTVFFFYQATQWVKSMRYLLPIYPFLALFAAWATIRVASRAARRLAEARRGGQSRRGLLRGMIVSLPVILLLGTALWCLTFTAIYRQPVTRVEASRWIFDNVPTAVTLETSDGKVINGPLRPGTALSATHCGTTLTVNPAQDVAITAIVLPKVDGLGMTERRTLTAVAARFRPAPTSGGTVSAIAYFSLPETGTAPVRLEFDDPVFVSGGSSVSVRLELTAGPDVVLETSVIANEHWDDPLPLRVDGRDPFWDWYQGLDSSASGQLNLYDFDTVEKRLNLLSWLDEADYIMLSSNRLYASIPRLPTRYPLTRAYYGALFDGSLGFELAAEFVSYPSLGKCQFPDQENPFAPDIPAHTNARPCSIALAPAEEAFSVYDHPTVYVFVKTPEYSRTRAQAALPRALAESAQFVTPRQAGGGAPDGQGPAVLRQGDALLASPRLRAEQEAGGTWSRIFDWNALLNRFPRIGAAVWGLTVTLLGWLAFPLLALLLPDLRLGGYGLARIVGLLIWSYCSWLLASLHLVPQTRGTLWVLLLLFGLCSVYVAYRHRIRLAALVAANWRDFVIIDSLFV